MASATTPSTESKPSKLGGSLAVAIGILGSRLTGLVRQSVFAYYFGNTAAADVFNAAFRIPNLLQNLFGEGALSASFIPVYAKLRAEGRHKEADQVAWAVASSLMLAVSLLVLLGVLATPWLIALIAPGFTAEKREAAITLVRIFFPGAGILVMSAWCLGVLNSHRAFLLSYLAPVAWSLSIVAFLVFFGRSSQGYDLAAWAAWGSVAGSLVQFGVQLPFVLRYLSSPSGLKGVGSEHSRTVFRNFMPAAVSRGVVQVGAYVDQMIASFLPTGAVAALAYAQVLYTLPVSLFGMAVAAAELPLMSSEAGTGEEVKAALQKRLSNALTRMAFFVVPSAVALFFLGDMLSALLFMRGEFGRNDAAYVWVILMGASLGLLATTMARLYSSAFFALGDTVTPLRCALARVGISAALALGFALWLPDFVGFDRALGAVGIMAASSLGGWAEYIYLRKGIERKIGRGAGAPSKSFAPVWGAALGSALLAWGVKAVSMPLYEAFPAVHAAMVTAAYCASYLALAHALGRPEPAELSGRALKLLRLKR